MEGRHELGPGAFGRPALDPHAEGLTGQVPRGRLRPHELRLLVVQDAIVEVLDLVGPRVGHTELRGDRPLDGRLGDAPLVDVARRNEAGTTRTGTASQSAGSSTSGRMACA